MLQRINWSNERGSFDDASLIRTVVPDLLKNV